MSLCEPLKNSLFMCLMRIIEQLKRQTSKRLSLSSPNPVMPPSDVVLHLPAPSVGLDWADDEETIDVELGDVLIIGRRIGNGNVPERPVYISFVLSHVKSILFIHSFFVHSFIHSFVQSFIPSVI